MAVDRDIYYLLLNRTILLAGDAEGKEAFDNSGSAGKRYEDGQIGEGCEKAGKDHDGAGGEGVCV